MEQPMIEDAQGQSVSGATAESVTRYDLAVRAYNSGYGDAIGLFDATCDAAPDFVMAYLAKAWVATAENLAMNERERGHLAALQQATVGARAAAVTLLDRHLMHYPFDL